MTPAMASAISVVRRRVRGASCDLLPLLLASLALAGCSDELEVRYRGRLQVSTEPMRIVLPMLGAEQARAIVADEDDVLWVVPFEEGEPCELGRVRALSSYRVSSDYRISLRYDADDGSELVRFVDAECEQHLSPVADAGPTALVNGHILAQVGEGLMAFDPWEDEQVTISEQVTEVGPLALNGANVAGLWVLEGDRLVTRSFEGELLRSVDEGVIDLDIAHSADSRVVYANDEGIFIIDASGLPGSRERLADTGCALRTEFVAQGVGRRHVTALSPCAERRLVTIDSVGRAEPVVVEHASHVRSYWNRAVLDGAEAQVWTFYITEVDDERHSFLSRPGGDATELPVALPTSRATLWPWPHGDFEDAYGRWLIVDQTGALGLWDDEDGWMPLAEAVEDVALGPSGWMVLHDFADGLGTLSAILPDGTLEEIAYDVPGGGLYDIAGTGPPAGTIPLRPSLTGAVVHEARDGSATLSSLGSTPGALTTLAEDIGPGSLRGFQIRLRGKELAAETEPMGALGYLHRYDPEREVGELAVRLDDGRTFPIDRDVGNYRPSDSQLRPGMLYAIPDGPRQGVWFAPQ